MVTLRNELINDPLGRGYAAMTDSQCADSLNTADRTKQLSSLSGDDMFNATDPTEWGNLTADQKTLWMAFCGRASVDPYGANNVAYVTSIFGGASTTVANLAAMRDTLISRATELGISGVRVGDIQRARA